jgi:hypothetical protein
LLNNEDDYESEKSLSNNELKEKIWNKVKADSDKNKYGRDNLANYCSMKDPFDSMDKDSKVFCIEVQVV